MNNKNIFAANLRRYMELNDKSRKDVCNDLGFNYNTYTDWVKGKKYPRMDKVEMLANYFGILKSDLIEEKDSKERVAEIPTATNIIPMPEAKSIPLNDKIKSLRKLQGLTLQEVGDAVGVGKSTVRKWESGDIENMRRDKIAALAKALHTTPAYLMGWEEEEAVPAAVKIPVLGKVAAGIPISAVENILDYEEIPYSLSITGAFVALQVKGHSMEPRIYEGDIVIVRVQPTAETGDLVVAIVNGDEATVKRLQVSPEGITLQPFNPSYQPIFYSRTDIEQKPVRIFGKVVELRAKF